MIIRHFLGLRGKPITEYIAETDADCEQLHAMRLDGTIPSPPDTKNWVRLCAALDGFHIRYGRWPARVRVNPISLQDLRDNIFTLHDFAALTARIPLIPDGNSMIAEDDTGAAYDYGQEGFPDRRPSPAAADWLGVKPRESTLPPRP